MIGRGSLNNPFVFQEIRSHLAGKDTPPQQQLVELFLDYSQQLQQEYDEVATLGRLKQWCGHLRFNFPVIKTNLQSLRRCQSTQALNQLIKELLETR